MAIDTADDRLAAALTRMPLFPLPNVVLFPNASLRLHIFEERYRAMTRDILAGERFQTVTPCPPLTSDRASADPIRPSPRDEMSLI